MGTLRYKSLDPLPCISVNLPIKSIPVKHGEPLVLLYHQHLLSSLSPILLNLTGV